MSKLNNIQRIRINDQNPAKMNKIEKLLDKIEAAQKEIKDNEYKSAIVMWLHRLRKKHKK